PASRKRPGPRSTTTSSSFPARATFQNPRSSEAGRMPLNPTPLAGRSAVILGGSGGIGAATARLFAEAGAAVAVVANTDTAKAQAVAGRLPGSGHTAHA